MRTVKFTDLINKSIERVGFILFPFSLKKWLKLLLIACLAGAISGGGGGAGGGGHSTKKADAAPVVRAASLSPADNIVSPAGSSQAPLKSRRTEREERFKKGISDALDQLMLLPAMTLGVLTFFVTAFFVSFMFLFMWLGARFKFVWFEAIVRNRDAIVEPFHAYRKEGDSIFSLWLALSFGFVVFLGVLAAWVFFTLASVNFFKEGMANAGGAISSLALGGVIFVMAIIALSLWDICVEHFVITIMAIDRISFIPAWRKFCEIYKNNGKDLWLYLLVLIGLKIICSIVEGIVFFIVLIALLLGGLLVFGLAYLFCAVLKAKAFFWMLALVLGIPAALIAIVAIIATGLPFAVFFRNFSLYFISSLNCGYVPLPLTREDGL